MQAVVLCGGRGTRLLPISAAVPKALAPVAGEPFIAHQLRLLRERGIGEVVLCVGHLGEQIESFAGDGSSFGLRVRYSRDGDVPLGTGGAVRNALPLLGEAFFVTYGDTYLDCDYEAVAEAFAARGVAGMLTVARSPHARYRANVLVRDGRVVRYHKTRPDPAMDVMYWGLGMFRRDAFARFAEIAAFDLGDVFIDLMSRTQLAAFAVGRRHYEIGCAAGLAETEALIAG